MNSVSCVKRKYPILSTFSLKCLFLLLSQSLCLPGYISYSVFFLSLSLYSHSTSLCLRLNPEPHIFEAHPLPQSIASQDPRSCFQLLPLGSRATSFRKPYLMLTVSSANTPPVPQRRLSSRGFPSHQPHPHSLNHTQKTKASPLSSPDSEAGGDVGAQRQNGF